MSRLELCTPQGLAGGVCCFLLSLFLVLVVVLGFFVVGCLVFLAVVVGFLSLHASGYIIGPNLVGKGERFNDPWVPALLHSTR